MILFVYRWLSNRICLNIFSNVRSKITIGLVTQPYSFTYKPTPYLSFLPPPIVLGSYHWGMVLEYMPQNLHQKIGRLVERKKAGGSLFGRWCWLLVGCWLLSPFSLVVLLECDGAEIKQWSSQATILGLLRRWYHSLPTTSEPVWMFLRGCSNFQ